MPDIDDVPTFVFEAGKAKARAKPAGEQQLLVLKGSTAVRLNSSVTTDRDRDERDRLIRAGVLETDGRNPDLLKFTKDHLFSSASAASGVIKNGNVSGPQSWKIPGTSKTLRDYWKR